MLSDSGPERVYLACGVTDLRKSIDGLAALVQLAFELDPFSDAWFVFCNRDRDKLKMLRWDHNGFWLYYRRLEKGRFKWPSIPGAPNKTDCAGDSALATQVISRRQLSWLLDGLNLEQRRAHPAVHARSVI
jgi:transposase